MRNPFKAAIGRGEKVIGLWLSMAHAYSAEICATAGFQWLLIDNEHAPNDLRSTLEQLQAVAAYPGHPVVRTVDGNPSTIKKLLDIGVQTLLVPMVDTPEQALALAAATRYPPDGTRGVGAAAARASHWGARRDYVNTADDDVCLLLQAESVAALDNLERISAVDGVHGIFIGPADLAASMGYRGRPDRGEVQEAIEGAIRKIIASGKAAGTLTGDPKLARRYLELGASFVAVGIDVTILAQGTRRLAEEFGVGTLTSMSVAGASAY